MVLGAEPVAGDGPLLALVDRALPRLATARGREERSLRARVRPVRRAELVVEPKRRVGVVRTVRAELAPGRRDLRRVRIRLRDLAQADGDAQRDSDASDGEQPAARPSPAAAARTSVNETTRWTVSLGSVDQSAETALSATNAAASAYAGERARSHRRRGPASASANATARTQSSASSSFHEGWAT